MGTAGPLVCVGEACASSACRNHESEHQHAERAACVTSRGSGSELAGDAASGHRFDGQDRVERCIVEQAAFAHEVADRSAGAQRLLGDLRRRGVADVRAERRGDRGAAIEQFAGARAVSRHAVDGPHAEHEHRLRQDGGRVQGVPRDDRHHDVQLELPCLARHGDRGVAAHAPESRPG